MAIINIRVDDLDKKLLERFAKSKNKTLSDVVRESIKDIIENEIHLELYQEGIEAFKKDNTTYTHGEVLKGLGIKKEQV